MNSIFIKTGYNGLVRQQVWKISQNRWAPADDPDKTWRIDQMMDRIECLSMFQTIFSDRIYLVRIFHFFIGVD